MKPSAQTPYQILNTLSYSARHENVPSALLDHLPTCRHAMVYTLAQQHGLTGMAYEALTRHHLSEHIPSPILQKLKHIYYRTLSDNMQNQNALENLRKQLDANIPLIVLKGPALIQQIYKNPALRPMGDIDLLIHIEHQQTVFTCLQDLGYQAPETHPDLYVKDNILFDLHTDPLHANRIPKRQDAIPLDIDRLWRGALPFGNVPNLSVLDPEHQIVTLCIHALKHGYERNIWLFDILFLTEAICNTTDNRSHPKFADNLAHTQGLLAHTYHALDIHLGITLPLYAQELQKSFPIGALSRKIISVSPQTGEFQILEPIVLSKQFHNMFDRLYFILSFVFPNRETMQQISGYRGNKGRWLSLPFRIVQLLLKGGPQLLKLIFRLLRTPTHRTNQ